MNEPNEKPRRYKWPWFVLAAFLLGVALAILWMIFDVRTIEQERRLECAVGHQPGALVGI